MRDVRSDEKRIPALRLEGFEGEWKRDEFGRVFTFLPTNTLSRADLNSSGYGVLNIHYGDVLTKFGNVLDVAASQVPVITKLEAVESFSPASFLRNGDVVIADTAEDETVGKTTEIQEIRSLQVVSGLHTYACRPIIGFAPWFLGQMLNSRFVHSQIILRSQGTKVTSISKQALSTVEVIFPSLPEQEVIGAFFRNLDSIIEQSAVRQKSLTSLKKTMLVKMFPQGTASTPEVRFEGFEGDWDKPGALRTIAERVSATGLSNANFPGVEFEDIVPGRNKLRHSWLTKRTTKTGIRFREGDVLYGKLRPYLNNVLSPDFSGTAIGDFWVLRSADLDSRFLYDLTQTEGFRSVASFTTGSKMPRADWSVVGDWKPLVPTLPEQQAIGAFFRNLDALIDAEEKKLTTLRNLKSALLTQMFV